MSRFSSILRSQRFLEVSKYIFGCASSLLLKMAIASTLTVFHASLQTAYFIATICAIIFSFFYHRRVTFGVSLDHNIKRLAREFASYAFSLAILCSFDYFIVVNAAAKFKDFLQNSDALTMTQIQIINNLCIVGSSLVLFSFRFFIYRIIFNPQKSQKTTLNDRSEHKPVAPPSKNNDGLNHDQSNPTISS